jgi:hypothetical protein
MNNIWKTIGKNTLMGGKKQKVEMHNFERSNHDLSYIWRSSASPGTIIPFLNEVGLPGDTFDIDLDAVVRTHPTLGPLFGSFELQLAIFEAPFRLYNAQLHNDSAELGMNMSNVQFPLIQLQSANTNPDNNNFQINPSCLLNYLGIRGLGTDSGSHSSIKRYFNGMGLLTYWDIVKNYMANKQETNAYVIHSPVQTINTNVSNVLLQKGSANTTVPQLPTTLTTPYAITLGDTSQRFEIDWSAGVVTSDTPSQIMWITNTGVRLATQELWDEFYTNTTARDTVGDTPIQSVDIVAWDYINAGDLNAISPRLVPFPLTNIDDMRTQVLQQAYTSPLIITQGSPVPYNVFDSLNASNLTTLTQSQEGLAIKTYQSDINNTWVRTAWINQITSQTAISLSGGAFTVPQLILQKKSYDMLNRIALSGGTFGDWQEVQYGVNSNGRSIIPMYCGGLSKEIIFNEVVSNSASQTTISGNQPLGQLAGKGQMGHKHHGGKVTIKPNEACYIMGIVSITPKIDYSQGNRWDTNLKNMNDLHVPGLDGIGFQDLVTDQIAYWDTGVDNAGNLTLSSAGKIPAWTNYRTRVNECYGSFAIPNSEMFMTLNRRYTKDLATKHIKDLTTYIDPSLYNYIFAYTKIDAQNFWVQIAVNMYVRRKMSAAIMPNLR